MTTSSETAEIILALCFWLGYFAAAVAILCGLAIVILFAWQAMLESRLRRRMRKPLPEPTDLTYQNLVSLRDWRNAERSWKRLRQAA